MALVDYFLKIDGISGESTDDKHKGEIEVASFSWGVRQTTARATGGAGAGKATFQDFQFTKVSDKASPALFQKCATGEHIKQAVLTARKAGETQQEFLKVTLSDLLVSSYQSGGTATPDFIEITAPNDVAFLSQNLTTDNALSNGFGDPMDQAGLRYAKLEFLEGNPQRIGIEPSAGGTLTFNAKTQTVTVGDWNGDGVAPVGIADGNIMRAVQEFDVKVLIGLLTAPFSSSSLHLLVNESRGPLNTPGDTTDLSNPGTSREGAEPHLRFDVLFYRNADNTVNADDLTRAGKRIGQLSVDPTNPNLASLDIDMLPILSKHDTDSFGIRLQLHGAGIPEPLETAEDRDEESGETAPSRDVTAFFSMTLNFDTA